MKVRLVFALAAASVLSGCWGGNSPLLPQAELVAPPVTGDYTRDLSGGGKEAKRYRGTANGKSLFVEKYEDGKWTDDSDVRFVSLGNSFYLGEAGARETDLFIIEVASGRFKLHMLNCDDELSSMASVTYDEESEFCIFSDYATLESEAKSVVDDIRRGDMARVYTTESYVRTK